jgi:hypothetical protein
MNPAYQQLLQRKNLLQPPSHRLPHSCSHNFYQLNPSPRIPNQQTAIREKGFGDHFKDTPPEFMNKKIDNKIERMNPPKKTKKRKKKKTKK